MILFPAIDLKDGRCVRLRQGDMQTATIFSEEPAAQAQAFRDQGFERLHVVDLDGAVSGRPANREAVLAILAAGALPVQLGGGVRDMASIEFWMQQGVERVILGTAALDEPQLVSEACRTFPGRIIVALDERGGQVAVKGWRETRRQSAAEAARRFAGMGVAAILHTAVEQDGMMAGMNIAASVRLAQETQLPVILSGGFQGRPDIERLLQALARARADGLPAAVEGVIAGRSLYENRFDVAEALALCRGAPC